MKKLLFSCVMLLISICTYAQDKIFTLTQNTPIQCEVIEINNNEIKYKPVGRPLPIMTIEKIDVVKVVYSNGEVFIVNNPLKDFSLYAGQRKWNLKLELLSPLFGHTDLFLEHSVKPGRSNEYELNIIGLGQDQRMLFSNSMGTMISARGVGIGVGTKFLRLPDYLNGTMRLRHILQGSYIKPAVSLSYYSRNFEANDSFGNPKLIRKPVIAINPNISFGRQFIFDNSFSLELYGSIGFSIDNFRKQEKAAANDNGSYYNYSDPFTGFGYTRFGSGDMGFTIGFGLRVGYLFNYDKNKSKK